MGLWIFIFIIALIVVCIASVSLTKQMEKIGKRLHFPEALIGLLAALGADSPEISSAFVALSSQNHEVGLGIVLGSNIVNLAGLLGVSAIVAGRVQIGLQGLLVNGGVGFLATCVIALMILTKISVGFSLFLLIVIIFPYVYFTSLHSSEIEKMRLLGNTRSFFSKAVDHFHRDSMKKEIIADASFSSFSIAIISFVGVIVGSYYLVHSAILLADHWEISHGILGTVILAFLTSIPNISAAIHLAREDRGAAVVSETFNSNTLNLLVGICLPALFFGLGLLTKKMEFSIYWLLGMSIVSIAVSSHHKGLHRLGGTAILLLFLLYVLAMIFWIV